MHSARKSADEMFPLVEQYLDGDLSRKAFCDKHGLSLAVLNYWIARYRREKTRQPGAFQEITPAPSSLDQALIEIIYPHGVRLRLFAPVEPAYLDRLLAPGRQRS